jgi:hypothetical protein
MTGLLIPAIAAVLMVLGLALAAAAAGGRRLASDHDALVRLSRLRGPSGQPFFPTDDAALELSDAMDKEPAELTD